MPGVTLTGEEQVVIVLYPGFTALDAVGPHYMLASMMGATVHLLATTPGADAVPSDLGLAVQPTGDLGGAPDRIDVLLVPGGSGGAAEAAADPVLLAGLSELGSRAGLVAGVCTGTLLLGAAGLLRGRRATSHWVARHLLARHGAEPTDQRVVTDGHVITGAGVTAGIDLALAIVARLRGDGYARALELQAEYAPRPTFGTGTPELAGEQLTGVMRDLFAPLVESLSAAAPGHRFVG
jgi:transcriptional regulator GlxA family with amidase domain